MKKRTLTCSTLYLQIDFQRYRKWNSLILLFSNVVTCISGICACLPWRILFTFGNRHVVIERKGAFFLCKKYAVHKPRATIADLRNKTQHKTSNQNLRVKLRGYLVSVCEAKREKKHPSSDEMEHWDILLSERNLCLLWSDLETIMYFISCVSWGYLSSGSLAESLIS